MTLWQSPAPASTGLFRTFDHTKFVNVGRTWTTCTSAVASCIGGPFHHQVRDAFLPTPPLEDATAPLDPRHGVMGI